MVCLECTDLFDLGHDESFAKTKYDTSRSAGFRAFDTVQPIFVKKCPEGLPAPPLEPVAKYLKVRRSEPVGFPNNHWCVLVEAMVLSPTHSLNSLNLPGKFDGGVEPGYTLLELLAGS